MFKDILAITGKPGLFKLVSRGNNMLIVESLIDGKRMPTYARDKIVSLADVSMYTMDDDMPLSEVLTKLGEMEQLNKSSVDPKKADNQQLRDYFAIECILPILKNLSYGIIYSLMQVSRTLR